MTITPVSVNPAIASSSSTIASQTSARAGSESISVKFSPEAGFAGPLNRVGSGVVSGLKDLEASRAARTQSMTGVHAGPANPVDVAKSELLAGPASRSLGFDTATDSTRMSGTDNAISAMTRTFDYAIETQLIVKTGSQISTSASSLMRGQ